MFLSAQVNADYAWIVKPVLHRDRVDDRDGVGVGVSPKHNYDGEDVPSVQSSRFVALECIFRSVKVNFC